MIVVVGNVPKSPLRVVGPVLVMPEPARTTKLPAVPRGTGVAAAWALNGNAMSSPSAASDATARRARRSFITKVKNFMVYPFDGLTWRESRRLDNGTASRDRKGQFTYGLPFPSSH